MMRRGLGGIKNTEDPEAPETKVAISLESGLGVIFILGHSLILAEMGKSSQVGGARMQLYFQDKHASFYFGDARNLDMIPDESVDCVLTSPPYWGKRSYGDETVAIWGGETGCQHIWTDAGRITVGSNVNIRGAGEILNPVGIIKKVGEKDRQQKVKAGSFCSLCGCWRGSLGLEPTYDCNQHGQKGMLELRPDLNGDEVVYVLEELAKLRRG